MMCVFCGNRAKCWDNISDEELEMEWVKCGYDDYVLDEAIEIERIHLEGPYLYSVYLDLKDWQFSQEVDEEGYHAYEIRLDIYDKATGNLAYFAWFSDPLWWGKVYVKTPDFAK